MNFVPTISETSKCGCEWGEWTCDQTCTNGERKAVRELKKGSWCFGSKTTTDTCQGLTQGDVCRIPGRALAFLPMSKQHRCCSCQFPPLEISICIKRPSLSRRGVPAIYSELGPLRAKVC